MNVQIVFLETDLYTAFWSGNSWFRAWQSAGINKIKFSSISLTLHLLTLSFYCKNLLYFFSHCSESLCSSGKKNEYRNPECCRPYLMEWTRGSQSYLDKFKHLFGRFNSYFSHIWTNSATGWREKLFRLTFSSVLALYARHGLNRDSILYT